MKSSNRPTKSETNLVVYLLIMQMQVDGPHFLLLVPHLYVHQHGCFSPALGKQYPLSVNQ
jgi:hypothetical protein